jgi:hypothetical protein
MLYFISHNEHGGDVVPRAPCCSNADCISQSCSADEVSVHRDRYSILPPVEPFAHETVRYVRHGNAAVSSGSLLLFANAETIGDALNKERRRHSKHRGGWKHEPLTADRSGTQGARQLLAQRRESILSAWRRAVDNDPELMTASTITRAQFVDHIPAVLDAFERRLSAQDSVDRAQAREEQRESAAEHGLHRWQQGYNQPETMCEWGHLHLCLLSQLQDYAAHHVDLEPTVMQTAHLELVRLCGDGVCASAARYAHCNKAKPQAACVSWSPLWPSSRLSSSSGRKPGARLLTTCGAART